VLRPVQLSFCRRSIVDLLLVSVPPLDSVYIPHFCRILAVLLVDDERRKDRELRSSVLDRLDQDERCGSILSGCTERRRSAPASGCA